MFKSACTKQEPKLFRNRSYKGLKDNVKFLDLSDAFEEILNHYILVKQSKFRGNTKPHIK